MPPRTSPVARRRVTLTTALLALSGTVTLAAASGAQASSAPSWPGTGLRPGNLLVATSVYENDTNIAAGTTQLPPDCGSTAAPCATAVVDGAYPYVFNNASVDPSFGVTSPITLRELTPSGQRLASLTVPNSTEPGVRADANQMVTSFSSKSELALNLSTNGKYVTFMGYDSPIDTADVSNANTPGDVDPTSADPGAYYREVAQLGVNGRFQFTLTNAFSGDNGRAALLNDEPGQDLYYAAGNAGNGANPEPAAVVTGGCAADPAVEPAHGPAEPRPADPRRQLQHHRARRRLRQGRQGQQLPRPHRVRQCPVLLEGQRQQRRGHRLLRRHHRRGLPRRDRPAEAARRAADLLGLHLQHERHGARSDGEEPRAHAGEHVRPQGLPDDGREERHRRERLPLRPLVRQPVHPVRGR